MRAFIRAVLVGLGGAGTGGGAGVDNLLVNDSGDNRLVNDSGDVLLIND